MNLPGFTADTTLNSRARRRDVRARTLSAKQGPNVYPAFFGGSDIPPFSIVGEIPPPPDPYTGGGFAGPDTVCLNFFGGLCSALNNCPPPPNPCIKNCKNLARMRCGG